jgi:phospholipid transport system substrate-binding protein
MNRSRVYVFLVIACLSVLPALATDGSLAANETSDGTNTSVAPVAVTPLTIVKSTIEKVIETNIANQGEDKMVERREKLREIINPHFDFEEMAKRSLGMHWRDISESEQEEYIGIFSSLLAKTYLARIDTVISNVVEYKSEKVDGPNATVKTMITHKGDKFPIDYKLMKVDERWRVYDVVIENIGLVANYRNEFAGIIRKEGFQGLLTRLKEKSARG